MSAQHADYSELPEHVRQIIERDGEIEFTPPSFERWLGRLQMARTMASMTSFVLVFLATYSTGTGWEGATVRGIIAAIVFYFFAWAAGLFVFGEMYDAEVKDARRDLEEKERERARRIEAYYRERLRQQAATGHSGAEASPPPSAQPALDDPLTEAIPGYIPTDARIGKAA
jgi:hypothetical protein